MLQMFLLLLCYAVKHSILCLRPLFSFSPSSLTPVSSSSSCPVYMCSTLGYFGYFNSGSTGNIWYLVCCPPFYYSCAPFPPISCSHCLNVCVPPFATSVISALVLLGTFDTLCAAPFLLFLVTSYSYSLFPLPKYLCPTFCVLTYQLPWESTRTWHVYSIFLFPLSLTTASALTVYTSTDLPSPFSTNTKR